MATFSDIIKRVYYLRGDADYTTASTDLTIIKSHINYAIKDILNVYPFSWDLKTADLTLSSGAANLPTDYNPRWRICDARITGSTAGDDYIFDEIDLISRDNYCSTDYKYWLTNNAGTYIFNTPVQTGTVTIYYYTLPTDLSSDNEVCLVPDGEAVAYLAAAKMWIGDERNQALKADYEQEATARISQMYTQDINNGPTFYPRSLVADNSQLNQRGN